MSAIETAGKKTWRKRLKIPEGYRAKLNLRETEEAIKFIKDLFQRELIDILNLKRASAPLVVLSETGVNDYLSGVEKPVEFKIRDIGKNAEIIQSLAKWKRMALADYNFKPGEGIYTDMNAIRPEENLDNLHSIYVDQWDWEIVMNRNERNLNFLKETVENIYGVIRETEKIVCQRYPFLPSPYLPENIHFIHAEELENMYPQLTPPEREDAICREKKAVFLTGIGGKLEKSNEPHDGRAADYDDWITETENGRKGLNGDILIWYPLLDCAFELSSMGIRVNRESLLKQLKIKDEMHKTDMPFHKKLINGELPQTIGGGIGQSRLCMLFLRKAHIGEVQTGIWPDGMRKLCREKGIFLL